VKGPVPYWIVPVFYCFVQRKTECPMGFFPSSLLFQNFLLISGTLFGITGKQNGLSGIRPKKRQLLVLIYSYGKVIVCFAPEFIIQNPNQV